MGQFSVAVDNYSKNKIGELRKLAADKAKPMGMQTTKMRTLWNKKQLIDFMIDGTVPLLGSELTPVEAVKEPLAATDLAAVPLKSALPVLKQQGKKKALLANGRSSKSIPSFDKWFCQIFPKDITYPAWKHLSKTATDVANICRAKSGRAAKMNEKDSTGRPQFAFTVAEADTVFMIPPPTFTGAIKRLLEIGFLERTRVGGMLDGNGIAALYRLSERWKSWEPPERNNTNIQKALAAKKQDPTKDTLSAVSKDILSGNRKKISLLNKGILSENPYFPT